MHSSCQAFAVTGCGGWNIYIRYLTYSLLSPAIIRFANDENTHCLANRLYRTRVRAKEECRSNAKSFPSSLDKRQPRVRRGHSIITFVRACKSCSDTWLLPCVLYEIVVGCGFFSGGRTVQKREFTIHNNAQVKSRHSVGKGR